MPSAMFNTKITRSFVKRALWKTNIGGHETNPSVSGNQNTININKLPSVDETTLLQKTGGQLGEMVEGVKDLVIAPAKWLHHMQENWYGSFVIFFHKNDPLWKLNRCGFLMHEIYDQNLCKIRRLIDFAQR
ncbi:hypothetical protein I4U23_005710 [Adineta vaga]|nr:hypothetical protein I4U23_005710 [Adineta vaga]